LQIIYKFCYKTLIEVSVIRETQMYRIIIMASWVV